MIGRQASKSGLTSDCKLHFVGLLDYFRGLQNFEANHAPIVGEIGNHPRTNLVTFLYARIPQRNGSLPSSLAATHRGFAFYVAFPKAPFDLAARRSLPRVS